MESVSEKVKLGGLYNSVTGPGSPRDFITELPPLLAPRASFSLSSSRNLEDANAAPPWPPPE
jgi:hypothetical protein